MNKVLILPLFLLVAFANVYPQQKIKDFYLSNFNDTGSRDWEVKGDEAMVYDNHVDIDKMQATYYLKNDTMSVKSEKATLTKDTMDAQLKDNVELTIPDRQGNYIKVTCSGPLEMRYNDGIATFNDNVVVESKEGKLYADKTTVFFSSQEKKMLKIVSEGNVKIVREDNVAFAAKATYLGDEKRVVLEGSPRLIYFPKDDETSRN